MQNGMINTVLNGLQIYRSKYTSDLVDENTISQSLLSAPHQVSNALSYIFGVRNESVLDYLTGGTGRTMTIENREYEWKVMIEADKPVTIKSAQYQGSSITSNMTPGINGTPIQVWVSEKFFGPGAIVEFDDNQFQARVMGEAYSDGHDWVYTLVPSSGSPSDYIPPEYLEAGKQLSRLGSAYEEGSNEADIVNYQTPFVLRNQLTTMRLKYDITGSAFATVMVIEMRDPETGKTTKYWSDYQEWIALRQWFKTIDYQLVYDKYDSTMKGTNGKPIYKGAGLLQQIAPANKKTYTKLTSDLLDEFLFDLSYNMLGMGERKFVALTGEMGMKEFDRVLKEKASGYNLIDTKFISGSGQELTLGGQFTTYKMTNGVELTLKHFPALDNTYHHRKLHPVSGKPVESYKMIFIDFGMYDGESNITKVVRKGREMAMWHEGGAVSPSGFVTNKNTLRASGYDGYTVYFLAEMGIMIKNPASCGILELDTE